MPQYTLKNGVSTFDRRLDRIPAFDQNSLNYRVQAALNAEQQTLISRQWSAPKNTPVLDQGAEGACFPEGTLIRLADGSHRRIEDIKLLDSVVTAEGNTATVTALMVREADRGLMNVDIEGSLPLRCTPNHPILTQRGYVMATVLLPGDLVAVTRWNAETDEPLHPKDLVDIRDLRGVVEGTVVTGGVTNHVAALPELLVRTPALGRLLGLYAAEGNTTVNKVVWTFGRHEEKTLVAETVALIKTVFDAEARLQYRPNNAINVVLHGKAWRRLFETLIPGTSRHGDMRLSAHITAGPAEYRRALLEGWLAGDGHFRRNSWQAVGVARQLVLDMHAIATSLGYRPTLRATKPTMNRHAATRQMRYEVSFGLGGGSNRSATQDERAVWRRVRAVTTEDFDGYVYNLEVEGDHSYVADSIGVHNCVGFGVTHELLYYPVPVRGLDAQFAREKIYWVAQRDDPWPGGSYPQGSPRYEGTSVLYGIKAAADLGYYTEYRWATSEKEMALGLGYIGPAIIGIDWYEGMFKPDNNGFLHPTGDKVGGHCCLIIGINVDQPDAQHSTENKPGYYTLHNSWGPSWGRNGNAKISRTDMAKLISANGEVCIITQRSLPPPAKQQAARKAAAILPGGE